MKDITTFVMEALASEPIKEGLKDVTVPRKGSYVYILKEGDTKVQKVKIENVIKRPMGKGYEGSYTYVAELADNEYGLKDYVEWRFKSIKYTPKAVETVKVDDNVYYLGIDRQSISDFVKADAGKKLEVVLQEIEKLEDELAAANEKKAQLEAKVNNEITESLLEGKEKFVKFSLKDVEDADKVMEKIYGQAQAAGIYYEKIDGNTFKLKLKPGQDISKIKDTLNGVIDAIPEDKKEEQQDFIDGINKKIEEMEDAVKPEEDPEKKEEE